MKWLTLVLLLVLALPVQARSGEEVWVDHRSFSLEFLVGASATNTYRTEDYRPWYGLDFGGRVRFFLEDYRYLGVEYRYLTYSSGEYDPAEITFQDFTTYLGVSWWGEPGDWRLDYALTIGFTYYAFGAEEGDTDTLELRIGAFIGPEYHLGGPFWLTARLTGFVILTGDYTPGTLTGEPFPTLGIQTGLALVW